MDKHEVNAITARQALAAVKIAEEQLAQAKAVANEKKQLDKVNAYFSNVDRLDNERAEISRYLRRIASGLDVEKQALLATAASAIETGQYRNV